MIDQARGHGGGSEVSNTSGSSSKDVNNNGLDEEQIAYLKQLYGFDQPLYMQFANWVYRLFTFQFGNSYYHHRSVLEIVKEKLPVSATFGIITFFLTYLVCIPLGIAKAIRDGSAFDSISSAFVLVGYSIPGFVLGVLLLVLFGGGTLWDLIPLGGLVSDNFDSLSTGEKILDYLHHIIAPIICLSIGSFAILTNLTKNSVLDNIRRQYVLTARAKGVTEKIVIWKHVFRNSMIPLVTGFAGGFLTLFFEGSLLIETLFSLDGLGLLSYEAVMSRDYPIVMANLFFFSLLFVVGNLLSDIMYVLVDPRVSFESMSEWYNLTKSQKNAGAPLSGINAGSIAL